MLARENITSQAELFSIELKFTIDTLNDWFSNIIKPKFLEISDIKKQIFVKENPIVTSKTTCSICGFLLDGQARGEQCWYDFIVDSEYLFLRNIYSEKDLEKMKIIDIKKFYEIFDKLIDLILVVEDAIENPSGIKHVSLEDFMSEDLNNVYCTFGEMKDDIDKVVVKKNWQMQLQ